MLLKMDVFAEVSREQVQRIVQGISSLKKAQKFDHHNSFNITQATHVRNKNSDIQGRSLNVIKVIFHTTKNCS